jgi:pyruvate formate lyase activating enzyme
MIIGGLQKTTLIDFPGKIAATVFTSGCNFFCPWCYSAELVLPEKIKKHPRISEEEFFNFLKSRQGLLEGVAICGGEPTLQADLPDFIKKIKELGFLVKLDTNGSNPRMLKDLIDGKKIDYVAMDIKTSKEKYEETLKGNVNMKDIEESVKILKEGKLDYEFRTTVVPGIHKKEDILALAQWIKGAPKYYLQKFMPAKTIDPGFERIKSYPDTWFSDVKKEISPYFNICEIRG